jgi:hypothetical protein
MSLLHPSEKKHDKIITLKIAHFACRRGLKDSVHAVPDFFASSFCKRTI